MRSKRFVLNAMLIVACGCIAAAQSGGNYAIKDATVEGSAHVSSGGPFVSEVRLGQGLAGQSISGGTFALGGGFFPAPPPPPVTPPAAPNELTATAASPTQIDISWADNSGNEDGFAIERCDKKKNCLNFVEVGRAGAGANSFQDLNLRIGTEYRYRIRAFNAAGNSDYSNIASAKTPRK
jgi:hypothetical protein